MSYLDAFDLFHKSQSGFRAGHSAETVLSLMTGRWLKALNERKVVGSVMVDFRRLLTLLTMHYFWKNSHFINLTKRQII